MNRIQDQSHDLNIELENIKAKCFNNINDCIMNKNHANIQELLENINMIMYSTFVSYDMIYHKNLNFNEEKTQLIREIDINISPKYIDKTISNNIKEKDVNVGDNTDIKIKNIEKDIIKDYIKNKIKNNQIIKENELTIENNKFIYETPLKNEHNSQSKYYGSNEDIEMNNVEDSGFNLLNSNYQMNYQLNLENSNANTISHLNLNFDNIDTENDTEESNQEENINMNPQRKYFIFYTPTEAELRMILLYLFQRRNIERMEGRRDRYGHYILMVEFKSRSKIQNEQIRQYILEIDAHNRYDYYNFIQNSGEQIDIYGLLL